MSDFDTLEDDLDNTAMALRQWKARAEKAEAKLVEVRQWFKSCGATADTWEMDELEYLLKDNDD